MKRIFMVIAACFYIAGSCFIGHCQDDSSIEQSEAQMESNLDSEIESEPASGTAEMEKADIESQSGEVEF